MGYYPTAVTGDGTSADSSTDPPGVDPPTDGDSGSASDAPTFYPTYYPTASTDVMRAGALNDNDVDTNWFQSENEQAEATNDTTNFVRKSYSNSWTAKANPVAPFVGDGGRENIGGMFRHRHRPGRKIERGGHGCLETHHTLRCGWCSNFHEDRCRG